MILCPPRDFWVSKRGGRELPLEFAFHSSEASNKGKYFDKVVHFPFSEINMARVTQFSADFNLQFFFFTTQKEKRVDHWTSVGGMLGQIPHVHACILTKNHELYQWGALILILAHEEQA